VWATIYQERRVRALSLVDSLNFPLKARALEIGCGPGLITVDLAQRGFQVQAIDTVAGMAEATWRELANRGFLNQVSVSRGDVHNLGFADNSFDLVVLIGVTEWLAELGRPLSEVARVLKPGGLLVAAGDNKWALHQVLDPLRAPFLRPLKAMLKRVLRALGLPRRALRVRDYSAAEFDGELRAAGFEKVRGVTLGFGPFSLFGWCLAPGRTGVRIHRWLQGLADRGVPILRSAGLTHVILARKQEQGSPPAPSSTAAEDGAPLLAPAHLCIREISDA